MGVFPGLVPSVVAEGQSQGSPPPLYILLPAAHKTASSSHNAQFSQGSVQHLQLAEEYNKIEGARMNASVFIRCCVGLLVIVLAKAESECATSRDDCQRTGEYIMSSASSLLLL